MNPQHLENLTRSALRATFLFFFDHPTEYQMEQYADLMLPDLLPRLQKLSTCDDLDDYMRRVIYDEVEAFHSRFVACELLRG